MASVREEEAEAISLVDFEIAGLRTGFKGRAYDGYRCSKTSQHVSELIPLATVSLSLRGPDKWDQLPRKYGDERERDARSGEKGSHPPSISPCPLISNGQPCFHCTQLITTQPRFCQAG